MPSFESVQQFSEKNLYALNYKRLLSRVKGAMRQSPEQRDEALKQVFLKSYLEDAKKYEKIRQELKTDAKNNFSMDEGLRERIRDMSAVPAFYQSYLDIVSEMAKEIDKSYTPKPFLGVSLKEAVSLQEQQLGSYTRRDQTAYTIKNYVSREDLIDEAEFVRTEHDPSRPQGSRNYQTMVEAIRGNTRELYVRKELARDELKNAGFFWRLFHRKEVREKQNYIRLAEDILKEVQFPEEAKQQAMREHGAASVILDEVKLSRLALADAYAVPDKLVSRFPEGKRPEAAVNKEAVEAYARANKASFQHSGRIRMTGKSPKEVGFFPGANQWSSEMYNALVNEYNREVDNGAQPDAIRERNLERIAQQIRIDIGVIPEKKVEGIYAAWDNEDMVSFMQQSDGIKDRLEQDVKVQKSNGLVSESTKRIDNPVKANELVQ